MAPTAATTTAAAPAASATAGKVRAAKKTVKKGSVATPGAAAGAAAAPRSMVAFRSRKLATAEGFNNASDLELRKLGKFVLEPLLVAATQTAMEYARAQKRNTVSSEDVQQAVFPEIVLVGASTIHAARRRSPKKVAEGTEEGVQESKSAGEGATAAAAGTPAEVSHEDAEEEDVDMEVEAEEEDEDDDDADLVDEE